MKILWLSNAMHVNTGYGNQTALFLPRIQALGHDVVLKSIYGVQGAPIELNGILVLPNGKDRVSNETITADFEWSKADVLISLYDVWTFAKPVMQQVRWAPWLPVDCDPAPPNVVDVLGAAWQPIAYSKFGQEALHRENIPALYVPHGVNTQVFKPMDKAEARKIAGLPEGKFIAGIIAANQSPQDRKSFDEQIRAFAQFQKRHADAVLYLHTDATPLGLINIKRIVQLAGLPADAVVYVHPYRYANSMLDTEHMVAVYSGIDVLMSASKGEGFGVPIIEAQACGTPVIVGKWTSMPELCFGGWKVESSGKMFYMDSYQFVPSVDDLEKSLEFAYQRWKSGLIRDLGEQARRSIVQHYDAEMVTDTYWKPTLEKLAQRIKDEQRRQESVVIEPVRPAPEKKPNGWQPPTHRNTSDGLVSAKEWNRPDVSVLMAVHNARSYPPGQLWSAIIRSFTQAGVSVEICAVDDHSTDGTTEELLAAGEVNPHLKVKTHAENRGPAAAYQTAAEMATGRYIIVQSVRSWYEPGAFAAMVKALDDNPEAGFVYGQTQYHGARTDLHTPPPFIKQRFWGNFDSLFGYMYRRAALDQGCRYETYLEREGRHIDIADYDFAMQLIVKMNWSGLALRDLLALHYLYSGSGQMTNLVHKYQAEINKIFAERWGAAA